MAGVAAGHSHTLIRMADLSLWAVNVYGQLGKGDNDNRNAPVQIDGGVRIMPLAVITVFLSKSPTAPLGTGKNFYGQLGTEATDRVRPCKSISQ